jgi:hypothetical protein
MSGFELRAGYRYQSEPPYSLVLGFKLGKGNLGVDEPASYIDERNSIEHARAITLLHLGLVCTPYCDIHVHYFACSHHT